MGRTVPSFRLAISEEQAEWRVFRRFLDRKSKKHLDDLFLTPKLYVSACTVSARPARIQPIMMSMILHNYQRLLVMRNGT